MAYNWLTGQYDNVAGDWNAYNTYAGGGSYQQEYGPATSSSSDPSFWERAGRGLVGYNTTADSSTGGALQGALDGYNSGGWVGAIVGGISGYYGGKENEEQAKENSPMEQLRFKEEIRQKMMKEQADALAKYTGDIAPPKTFNYTNSILGGKNTGLFGVQAPTQPVVNPLANSYGLLRG